jgi:hypothetical protein
MRADMISMEAKRDFNQVNKRLAAQQLICVGFATPLGIIYYLMAAKVIPITYWVAGLMQFFDGFLFFIFTTTNFISPSRRPSTETSLAQATPRALLAYKEPQAAEDVAAYMNGDILDSKATST